MKKKKHGPEHISAAAKSNILLNFPALDVFLLQLAEMSNIVSSSIPSYIPKYITLNQIPYCTYLFGKNVTKVTKRLNSRPMRQ